MIPRTGPSRGLRVLIFHGYLLRGTGSNIYTASLARHLVALGHEVHLLCQDHEAARLDFVDAIGRWRGGRLRVDVLRRPVRCTVHLPDIGGLLPVYVADHYDGFVARTFPELTDEEVDRYIAANVTAVRDVAAEFAPDLALANHLVMGPVILARALAGRVPYAVKVHGSALEYTVRRHRERFLPYAREGLAGAVAVLVGSAHTAESMYEVAGMPGLRERTRLLPPGVDAAVFRRSPPATARRRLRDLADRLERAPASWGGETGAAAALRAIDPDLDRVVTYVGKLIPAKGVDLLIAAWPLVVARVPRARLVITGFGTYRETLGELVRALGAGDLVTARRIAGGEPTTVAERLRYVAAFLDEIADSATDRGRPRQTEADRGRPRQTEAETYIAVASRAMGRVHFTGRIDHTDLPGLLSVSEAQVVPSTFPEAFGMVAAEAACCGALPLCSAHSGLAEVTSVLAPALDEGLRPLISFTPGPGAVIEIADKLVRWLALDPATRAQAATALAAGAAARFGWARVAEGLSRPPAGGSRNYRRRRPITDACDRPLRARRVAR